MAQQSRPRYGIVVARDVMVPIRDGVRLATDIIARPSTASRSRGAALPSWGRTSYDKTDAIVWVRPVADYFVPRGYAVVLQDVRGRQKVQARHEGAAANG
jgi:predicted acyl esterase